MPVVINTVPTQGNQGNRILNLLVRIYLPF